MPDRLLFATGALGVALAAAPYAAFDLDRFFAPKELVLHFCALALALRALRRAKALEADGASLLLLLYVLLSAASALLSSEHGLALRALAVTLSGAGLFWCARAADEETRRAIVVAAAAAAVGAAATSLAQAYGFGSALFSPRRVPGGTLGNRNFVAHLAAVCAPAAALATLRARRFWIAGAAGAAVLAAALVLTRSRAALLGLAAGGAVLACGWRGLRASLADRELKRLKALAAAAAVGALAALALPNKLQWKSGSPYLDTITGLADYSEGSGHGRVIQYTRSLRLAAAHPLLGAGPGNWQVAYPKYARGFDHSVDYTTGRTINPWPSSDWVAVISERGLAALAALAGAFALLFLGGLRLASPEGWTLCAMLAAAAVVGCFDAFQLLAAPAFLLWAAAGALAAPPLRVWSLELTPRVLWRVTLAAVVVWAGALVRTGDQLFSMARGRAKVQLARKP